MLFDCNTLIGCSGLLDNSGRFDFSDRRLFDWGRLFNDNRLFGNSWFLFGNRFLGSLSGSRYFRRSSNLSWDSLFCDRLLDRSNFFGGSGFIGDRLLSWNRFFYRGRLFDRDRLLDNSRLAGNRRLCCCCYWFLGGDGLISGDRVLGDDRSLDDSRLLCDRFGFSALNCSILDLCHFDCRRRDRFLGDLLVPNLRCGGGLLGLGGLFLFSGQRDLVSHRFGFRLSDRR